MQFSGTRKFVASLGNYGEKYEASRSVTFSHQDLGYTDEEWLAHVKEVGTDKAYEALADTVMEKIQDEIDGELEEANDLLADGEDSFLRVVFPPRNRRKKRS